MARNGKVRRIRKQVEKHFDELREEAISYMPFLWNEESFRSYMKDNIDKMEKDGVNILPALATAIREDKDDDIVNASRELFILQAMSNLINSGKSKVIDY